MYVTVDASIGMSSSRVVFIPLARIKEEKGELLVPYSSNHLQDAPEIEPGDEVSEEDDATLRAFTESTGATRKSGPTTRRTQTRSPRATNRPRRSVTTSATAPGGRKAGWLSRAPSGGLVITAIASVQFGSAIAAKLFAATGPAAPCSSGCSRRASSC